jgi:hypothetical protein
MQIYNFCFGVSKVRIDNLDGRNQKFGEYKKILLKKVINEYLIARACID